MKFQDNDLRFDMELQLYFTSICYVLADEDNSPAQLSLEFRVFLVSAQTGKHTQESRTLQFWFAASTSDAENAAVAQEFFRELVSPQDFPRGECILFVLFCLYFACMYVINVPLADSLCQS